MSVVKELCCWWMKRKYYDGKRNNKLIETGRNMEGKKNYEHWVEWMGGDGERWAEKSQTNRPTTHWKWSQVKKNFRRKLWHRLQHNDIEKVVKFSSNNEKKVYKEREREKNFDRLDVTCASNTDNRLQRKYIKRIG